MHVLLAALLVMVPLAAGSGATGAGPAAGQAPQQKAYAYPAGMEAEVRILRVLGFMPPDKQGDSPRGALADVAVSDAIAVTGVPAEYVRGCLRSAVTRAQLETGFSRGTPVLGNTRLSLHALARWWTAQQLFMIRTLDSKEAAAPRVPMPEMIRRDAEIYRTRQSVMGKSPRTLGMGWLLFPRGLEQAGPNAQAQWVRNAISLRVLLDRFEPDLPATADNADSIAEELVWTRELGLGDGTPRTLPDVRRAIQAAILEAVGYEIGDPADADAARRETARRKLDQAKTDFRKTWDATPAAK